MPLSCSSFRLSTRSLCGLSLARVNRASSFRRNVTTEAEAWQIPGAEFEQQLESMKSRLLPTAEGQWDKFNIQALRQSIQSHLSLPYLNSTDPIPPGYHQVSFNTLIYEHELSHDGAERRHAPNDDWKFRVWAGGYIEFPRSNLWADSPNTHRPNHVAVNERITDARLLGTLNDDNAKVMVTLTKTLFAPQLSPDGRPVYRNDGQLRIFKTSDNILIKEEKHLCFMREIPESLKSPSARKIAFPSDPDYSQTMVPSPTLLFRFSSLTRNAHAIHLDGEYTRQVYGLSKLIVHGPLTSVLMLDILGEALVLQSPEPGRALAVRSFQYRNLLPLFVNEPITIACKKLHDMKHYQTKYQTESGIPWEKWDVWIQKGEGHEATLAVRGTAWVSPAKSPGREKAEESSEEDSAPSG